MKKIPTEKIFVSLIGFLVLTVIGLLTLSIFSYNFKTYTVSALKVYCSVDNYKNYQD